MQNFYKNLHEMQEIPFTQPTHLTSQQHAQNTYSEQ
jgi:hypothetical protein